MHTHVNACIDHTHMQARTHTFTHMHAHRHTHTCLCAHNAYSVCVCVCVRERDTPNLAFRHPSSKPARTGYATEGVHHITTYMSTSALDQYTVERFGTNKT